MSGGHKTKQPSNFLSQAAIADFIKEIANKEQSWISRIVISRRGGKLPGTFAHWQIALAYAKWLSPALHMQVNEIYARYKAGDATLAEEVIDRVENPEDLLRIERRARAASQYKRLSSVVFNNGGGQSQKLKIQPSAKRGGSIAERSNARKACPILSILKVLKRPEYLLSPQLGDIALSMGGHLVSMRGHFLRKGINCGTGGCQLGDASKNPKPSRNRRSHRLHRLDRASSPRHEGGRPRCLPVLW
ncbi:KilA-N domain-containing protein [Solidesulfovibrio carbinoliphilus]|uniref:KilA-N domain-containing protein n=1 Tax=Solidesulfovibrio carbinoliphilus TaxID=345370 RepID=UPI0001C25F37